MENSPKREDRKLVAILFADIQGYTAMMESDESNAMSRLKRYQMVLNESVSNNQGEIIKNYGDGSLCIFSSVLDALNCAKSVQQRLSQEPKVPLRIGLHLGDVTHSEGDVYGNDINIASRIESLGIAGSVLMSGDFLNKVKNQSGFEFQSLGQYHFKNIEEKMPVFALASEGFPIPAKSDMAGKLKQSSPNYRQIYALIGSIFVLFIAYYFLIRPGTIVASGAETLTKEQRDKRVTVQIFENKTGLDNLDNFGNLISDWLTSMLRETGEANVINQENIKVQLAGIGPLSSKKLFTETGIGILIKGNYYMLDDQLVILPSIVDTETGEVHTSTPINGSLTNKEDLLKDLTQRILGYWKVRNQKRYLQKPPNYEAYLEYLKGWEVYNEPAAEMHFKKAYQLDTTFMSPLLQLIPFYHNMRRYEAQDSLYSFLDNKQSNFTRWELLIYQFHQARDDGKYFEAANLSIEAFKMDPSHFLSINRAVSIYLTSNYPQRAIDLLQSIDTLLRGDDQIRTAKEFIVYATLLKHDYEKVVAISEKIMTTRKLVSWEPQNYVDGLIYTHQYHKIPGFIESLDVSPDGYWLYRICNGLQVVNEDSLSQIYVEDLKNLAEENKSSPDYLALRAQAEMFSKNWDQAISYFEMYILKIGYKDVGDLAVFGDLSICYAKNGQMSKALELLNTIERDGSRNYYKSRLLILEKKYDEALDSLSVAIRLRHPFGIDYYKFDHNLKLLFDNPRFEELVKVKD
jgi:class 3 adenylate cyclase/tetratricopeptide (TPR) repeat protein